MAVTKQQPGNVIDLNLRRPTRALVHQEEPVACQFLAFPLKRGKKGRPSINRDAFPLTPLLDGVLFPANVSGHRRQGRPTVKHVFQVSHAPQYASDELSGQGQTMIPMTETRPHRTISPMGRGTTPVKFRAEMAKRLMSARIVAGYRTKKEAADALQIGLDRYEKWESGRTPVPAQYVGPICELFHIDANYLFGIQAASPASRKTGTD